jgi:hypothetical protein
LTCKRDNPKRDDHSFFLVLLVPVLLVPVLLVARLRRRRLMESMCRLELGPSHAAAFPFALQLTPHLPLDLP